MCDKMWFYITVTIVILKVTLATLTIVANV